MVLLGTVAEELGPPRRSSARTRALCRPPLGVNAVHTQLLSRSTVDVVFLGATAQEPPEHGTAHLRFLSSPEAKNSIWCGPEHHF